MGLWVEISLILALVICNGILAMSETAIVSTRQARLQQRAERGERGAAVALNLTKNPISSWRRYRSALR